MGLAGLPSGRTGVALIGAERAAHRVGEGRHGLPRIGRQGRCRAWRRGGGSIQAKGLNSGIAAAGAVGAMGTGQFHSCGLAAAARRRLQHARPEVQHLVGQGRIGGGAGGRIAEGGIGAAAGEALLEVADRACGVPSPCPRKHCGES